MYALAETLLSLALAVTPAPQQGQAGVVPPAKVKGQVQGPAKPPASAVQVSTAALQEKLKTLGEEREALLASLSKLRTALVTGGNANQTLKINGEVLNVTGGSVLCG